MSLGGILAGSLVISVFVLVIVYAIVDTCSSVNYKAHCIAFVILLIFLVVPPYFATISTQASVAYSEEFISASKEQLKSFNTDMGLISNLNPEAQLLVNQDSPIASSMRLRSELIRDIKREQKRLIEDKVFLHEVAHSPFKFLL